MLAVLCLAYVLGELKESLWEFLVVALNSGTAVAAVRVATAHHIMQLGCGDQTIVLKRNIDIINRAIHQPLYCHNKLYI